MNRVITYFSLLSIILASSIALKGQYSISYRYVHNSYDTWNERVKEDKVFPMNHEIAAGYYLKLPNYRIEFQPEVIYGSKTSASLSIKELEGRQVEQSYVGLSVPIHFYLFSMKDDCDCPTFSKQGPKFLNAISAYIAPRLRYNMRTMNDQSETSNLVPSLGGGLAYDLGINDLVTITPHLGVNLTFQDEWNSKEISTPVFPKDGFTSFIAGVRLLLRFDYVRKNRW